MNPKHSAKRQKDGYLDIEEIRLISDLRIMHAKVDELYGIVENLKRRHTEALIVEYADRQVLPQNISRVVCEGKRRNGAEKRRVGLTPDA